jgi:effector-binding domain-containing protein
MKTPVLLSGAALILLVSCKPKEYEVTRTITINAPAEVIFAHVNNLKAQEAWSPWEKMDGTITKIYSGPEAGVGAKYAWSGNDSVGTGYMEHFEVFEPTHIRSYLVFTSPWQSESVISWTFDPVEGGTQATWSVKGSIPGYLFWMGQSTMDRMMGPDFESGLAALKTIAEAIPRAPTFEYNITEVPPVTYYGITTELSFREMDSTFFAMNFAKLSAYLGPDRAHLTDSPFALVHVWDEQNQRAKVTVAMAAESRKPGTKEMVKETRYGGKVLVISHFGPYENTGAAHYFADEVIAREGYEITGSPWESYVTDAATEPDRSKWLTHIVYPIAPKADAAAAVQ